MSKRRTKQFQEDEVKSGAKQPLSRKKIWAFRLAAAVLAPFVFLGLLESGLRIFGYGYDTHFLHSFRHDGRDLLGPNNQFGWRFFGPDIARWPFPFAVSQAKSTNVVRVIVLGESAARGEPQPEFGLPRVLEAMLSLRYPEAHFEVINAAMTAINSHAILPIARDCVPANADIWVIYMGNNEVVGPFGAGTVFGSQSPPLALIRANLALKTIRSGQLLDSTLRGIFRPASAEDAMWGGMGMFLEQQVRATDVKMQGVYHHFRENLAEIIRLGHQSGAGIVVSTVAVNLKDCAPFASAHRPDLTQTERANWEQHYQAGCRTYEASQYQQAATEFHSAAQIDDTFADLSFRQGNCALALGNVAEASEYFHRALDFDTLRFRCDSKLNEIIRNVVSERTSERIRLVDAESSFATQSADTLPGREFFYEHVHLTFEGNYHLARMLSEQIEPLLPPWVVAKPAAPAAWPTLEACSRRLGRSAWHEAAALNSIIATMKAPPFTGQLNHEPQLRQTQEMLAKLTPGLTPDGIMESLRICEAALASNPNDAVLHRNAAVLKRAKGDRPGAISAARVGLELLPNDSEGWAFLGGLLVEDQQYPKAEEAFRRAFQLGPQGTQAKLNLARLLATVGKHDESIAAYRRILAQRPHCVPALLQLGQVVEKLGRQGEAAGYYQKAFSSRSQREPDLVELGDFFQQRREFETALTLYREALMLNPSDPKLQLAAGRCLASLGRYEEATRYTAEVIRLAPERVDGHQLHGIVLLKLGQNAMAIEQFQAALRLDPDSPEAHLNLGTALAQSGRLEEASPHFTAVLARDPANAQARKFLESLRTGTKTPP